MSKNISVSLTEDLKENLQEAKTNLLRYVFFFFFFLMYTVLGALLFFYIEECYDVVPKTITEAEYLLRSLCQNISTKKHVFNRTSSYNEWTFCLKHGTNSTTTQCELDAKKFSLWQSYTTAIATTIGFGDVVTRSDTGKSVTMIYALPGIALAAATYIPAGRGIVALTKCVLNIIGLKCFKKVRASKCPKKILFIQTVLAVLFLLTCASYATLDELENYSFLNAIYFAFITLTTIGFGDFTFKVENYYNKPHLGVTAFLLFSFGLGIFSSVVSSLTDVIAMHSSQKEKIAKGPDVRKRSEIDVIANMHATNMYRKDNFDF